MIPIFSILSLLLSIVIFIFFLKLYFSYQKSKLEAIGIFSKAFLFLSLFWFFVAPPKLITNNLKLIQLSFDLSMFFGYFAIAYCLLIPFKTYYHRELPKALFFAIIGLGIIILIFNILNLKPAHIHFKNNIVFWSENRNALTDIISNILIGIILTVAAITFYRGGVKSKEKPVRLRAFLISASLICILLTGIPWAAGFFSDIFISKLGIFILETISVFLMIIAIFFAKPKSKTFYKKIYEEEGKP